jgi:ABC-type polysaccharide/polyol phosphate export permease
MRLYTMARSRIKIFFSGINLLWMLAKRDLTNRYASSYAGFAWNIGVPLFNALVLAVVFSALMNGRMGHDYGNVPFVLFYFIPFSLWTVFSEVVSRSAGIIREYGYLVNKISFPFWVLPMVPFASAFLSQTIILAIIAGLLFYLKLTLASTAGLFFVIWLLAILLTIGVSYAVSAISVYLPDMGQIVPLVLNVMFWMTPILYPPLLVKQHAPAWLQNLIIHFNPFYYIAEYSRYAVISGKNIPLMNLGILFGVGALFLFLGIIIFQKLKTGFADVI